MAENPVSEHPTAQKPAAKGLLAFEHNTLGQRVLFGTGDIAEHLAAEITRLGAQRVMVIASVRDRSEVERITTGLPVAVIHDDIAPHVPIDKAKKFEPRRSTTA